MSKAAAFQHLITELNQTVLPFDLSNEQFYRTLLNKIADASIVLLGESTHGTTEFYLARMEITKRLITEKNFHAIAIEGDWTSTYQLHRFINGSSAKTPEQALEAYARFPAWMWANETMPNFLTWLREYNDAIKTPAYKLGFYGLDLYCLNDAMQAVINYLEKVDPQAAAEARKRYSCFELTAIEPQDYGYAVDQGIKKDCIDEVSQQFIAMQNLVLDKFHNELQQHGDTLFYAMQNALVVKNAEEYYRTLFEARDITWNLRDKHMAQTVRHIKKHIENKINMPAKIVIWAHNSHVGDARATEMATQHEINLGQLMREQFPNECFLLGFSTAEGTVTAANDWGMAPQKIPLQSPLPSSYEELFHALDCKNFLLDLSAKNLQTLLNPARLQRAIGVIYRPESERGSHYFFTKLLQQFNALIHIDKTTALTPLFSKASTVV